MINGFPLQSCAASRYAANCSSSVGMAAACMNSSSVRKTPMPSAPACIAARTSSTLPALANTGTRRSMAVSPAGCRDIAARSSGDGSMTRRRAGASTRRRAPAGMAATSTPSSAGIPLLRAMMQTWLVTLPRAVMKARTREKSIRARSEGNSSSATMMTPSSATRAPSATAPADIGPACVHPSMSPAPQTCPVAGKALTVRRSRIRRQTSRTSSVRARRYSSSMSANMAHIASAAASTAAVAESPSASAASTCSSSSGSSSISRWAAKTAPSGESSSADAASSAFTASTAAAKRARSSSAERAGSPSSAPAGTGLSGGMQAGETVADGALEPAAEAICSAKPEAQPPTEASAGRTMRITTLYEMTYICTLTKGASCLSPQ